MDFPRGPIVLARGLLSLLLLEFTLEKLDHIEDLRPLCLGGLVVQIVLMGFSPAEINKRSK